MQSIIKEIFNEHLSTSKATMSSVNNLLEIAANLCITTLANNGKILLFGNGGSAADAQHIAAELVGRFKKERKGLAAIALTTDSSALTCIGNDYGYDNVFERQVEALANKDDLVIGISTGGTSINVIKGLEAAKKIGCNLIGLSGKDGGEFNNICHINIIIPSKETARIQEMHILIGHIICELIDDELAKNKN
jgi:D-sedoheptulose 7-phosphate isomerase